MVLGSHNSWSYLKPKVWWKRPFAFIGKCQDKDIKTQYEEYNVRCFDLRIKYDRSGTPVISHGFLEFDITMDELYEDLKWLNSKGDVYLRILFEARTRKEYEIGKYFFGETCAMIEKKFKKLKCWCGRNLYNWEVDYNFNNHPTCTEKYSSVCSPKWIDDWWPRLFALRKNKKIKEEGTYSDILLIDFVNIG